MLVNEVVNFSIAAFIFLEITPANPLPVKAPSSPAVTEPTNTNKAAITIKMMITPPYSSKNCFI